MTRYGGQLAGGNRLLAERAVGAMGALDEARRGLYVPCTYHNYLGYTTVETVRANPELEGLTDTGTREVPSLRVVSPEDGSILYSVGKFTATLRTSDSGSHRVLTSMSEVDLSVYPYPDGYTLTQYNELDPRILGGDPGQMDPLELYETLRDTTRDPDGYLLFPDKTGHLTERNPDETGVELGNRLAQEIMQFSGAVAVGSA